MSDADRFARDLLEEWRDVLDEEFVPFRKDVVLQVVAEAEARTPRKTGRLAEGWAVSRNRQNKRARGGTKQAERALARLRPFDDVLIMNNDFRATFFELGTVHMAPQPMLAPAAQAVENLEREV